MHQSNPTNTPIPNKMGVMPVGRLLLNMAWPVMVSMLIQGCYNVVDSIFVAQISEDALTAVSLAFPLQMLSISVAVGTGVGINSLISRRLGEKRYDDANQGASNGLFLMACSYLLFLLIGLFLVKPFFHIFTDDVGIREMGISYLTIAMTLSLGVFMQIGCERIVQATGNTIYPMFMQLAGAVTNLILDPILIFGYFGLPAMGVTGAALATVIGQFVGMGLSFYLLFKKKHAVRISFRNFRPNAGIIRDIYVVGVPSIVMQSIGSVMTFGLNKILIAFTPTAVSVLGVYFKLNSFAFMPVFALNGGSMSIMAYNYGARNRKRIMQTLKYAVLYSLCIMLVGTLVFHLFTPALLLLFNASEDMLALGVPALRIISLSFPGAALCISLSNLFQAVGKGALSLWMSIIRQLVVILPVSFLFSRLFGLAFVWYAFPISEVISLTMAILIVRHIYKTMLLPLDEAPAAVPEFAPHS
ncbi:MATE family efflux transporter [Christensenellaceae bacterium OttesenSCG-928-L17]|nr:MATE family efflux transporter [Christensenellaceae bacterium OttesenSCG-928-L17]